MPPMQSMRDTARRAFTIVELLVVIAIISLLVAILLPAMGRARDAAMITQSSGNLGNLSKSNAAYGADWSDRHFTACPDDYGQAPSLSATAICGYGSEIACPSQQLLGFSSTGGLWGYWVQGSYCPPGLPGICGNWPVLIGFAFVAPGSGGANNEQTMYDNSFGAYEMPNTKAFNTYVNGRFYDKVFVAPKDRIGMFKCEFGFQNEGEFTPAGPGNQTIFFPTYIWSPACMFSPGVLSSAAPTPTNGLCALAGRPTAIKGGAFRAPTQGMTRFPDQKTLMIEKLWLQNREGPEQNNNFATPRSWLFNEGYNSSPVCLFFDGHIQQCGMNQAINDDKRATGGGQSDSNVARCSTATGLWHRGTPAGICGWYSQGAGYDPVIDLQGCVGATGFHMMTCDGILGRDILKSSN